MQRRISLILLGIGVLLTGMMGGGAIFLSFSAVDPAPEALAALESTAEMQVAADDWLVFSPSAISPTTGLIFYPGGLVDHRAYAPPARDIAAAGYQVVVVPMPFNLAVFSPGRATAVQEAFPHIENWVLAGHSLGGAMACTFIGNNPEAIQGLVLWAAYPPANTDLSMIDMPVTAIFGERDGLVSAEERTQAETLLPPETTFVLIEGGNHAQFGAYGPQNGDLAATISAEAQQTQIVAATLATLADVAVGR